MPDDDKQILSEAPPDKTTADGMTEHLLFHAVPSLIANLRGHLDGGPYHEHEVRDEAARIERDIEQFKLLRHHETAPLELRRPTLLRLRLRNIRRDMGDLERAITVNRVSMDKYPDQDPPSGSYDLEHAHLTQAWASLAAEEWRTTEALERAQSPS